MTNVVENGVTNRLEDRRVYDSSDRMASWTERRYLLLGDVSPRLVEETA